MRDDIRGRIEQLTTAARGGRPQPEVMGKFRRHADIVPVWSCAPVTTDVVSLMKALHL